MTTIIKDETLTAVADAIREKTGKTDKITPVDMATEIANIPTGGSDTLAEYLSASGMEYEVPATVTQLKNQAFRNSDFSKISFKGNTKVKNGLSSLFNGNYNLKSVSLNGLDTDGVTSTTYMFYNCSNLTSLDVSNFDTSKVTDMSYMFSYCSNLTDLSFIKELDFSSATNTDSCFPAYSNYDFSDGFVNNTLKVADNFLFFYYRNLTITKISNTLEKIGSKAFTYCSSLKTLWLPESCTSIGSDAFYGCTALTDIYTPLTERPDGWDASAFPSTTTLHFGVSEEEYDKIIGATS